MRAMATVRCYGVTCVIALIDRGSTLDMSLTHDSMPDAGGVAGRQSDVGFTASSTFRFVPRELALKCRKLIDSYHTMNGYAGLADMLWNSNARDIIDCHRELAHIFKSASKSRCAKRANESLLLIATVIVSLEVLARDFSGWGKRFPSAKREAEELLLDLPHRDRAWFMDKYLYPSLTIHRDRAIALAPSPPEHWAAPN
jgi:hypothetical protein